MTKPIFLRAGSLGAALLCSTAAYADVTAQQVWDNWKTQIEVYGDGGVTVGNESMSGDTLTVETLTLSMSDDDVTVNSEMGPLTFTEQGDGTVRVGMPESYPMSLEIEGSPVELTISNEGLDIVASGTPDALSYALVADSYSITVDSVGGEIEEEVLLNAATITMEVISGDYIVRSGDLQNMDYSLTMAGVDINVDLREKGGSGVIQFNGDMADLMLAAKLAMPMDMDMDAPETMFADGFAFEGGYSIGAAQYDFNIDADGESASGNVSTDSTALSVSADYDGMLYQSESTGIALDMTIPEELPFPIQASMSTFGFTMDVPLSQANAPRGFELGFELRDLAVGDGLWNLFDPGEILPRDPATVALNLTGNVTPFFDFMDPEQAQAAAMADLPGEIHDVTLNDLTMRVAGAEVMGEGAFTFDNTDFQTIPGMPRPEGQADFRINGVNGLIDKLIQMGLIPEDQAMMPRMMLGMFATPVGDDQLTSTIEINDQGHILANGQRIQ